MHVAVREIHVSSEPAHQGTYFLRVDWKGRDLGSGFQLLVTDGQDAWRGQVSEAAVCAEAEELEMQKDKYIQDLHQALTETETSVTYSFSLTPSQPGRSVTLAYEKVQKDISFRLGSVVLSAVPEPAEAVRELLIHGLERGTALERHNQKLQQENHRLRQEQQYITAELKRYTSGKEALEAELYSRFVLVLNEKKAKIRSLQETVTHLQDARSSEEQKKKDLATSSQTPGQEEVDEEDEYGGSTDEELEGEAKPTSASTLPSRESRTPSPLDDSLSDITDVAPCRKRRLRHVRAPDLAAKRPNPQTSQRRSCMTKTCRSRARELNCRVTALAREREKLENAAAASRCSEKNDCKLCHMQMALATQERIRLHLFIHLLQQHFSEAHSKASVYRVNGLLRTEWVQIASLRSLNAPSHSSVQRTLMGDEALVRSFSTADLCKVGNTFSVPPHQSFHLPLGGWNREGTDGFNFPLLWLDVAKPNDKAKVLNYSLGISTLLKVDGQPSRFDVLQDLLQMTHVLFPRRAEDHHVIQLHSLWCQGQLTLLTTLSTMSSIWGIGYGSKADMALRSDSPMVASAAANKQQAPRRATDAAPASPTAEDLFEDF
ncbi:DNA repair protein XRCC4 [Diretmus argenteus]